MLTPSGPTPQGVFFFSLKALTLYKEFSIIVVSQPKAPQEAKQMTQTQTQFLTKCGFKLSGKSEAELQDLYNNTVASHKRLTEAATKVRRQKS